MKAEELRTVNLVYFVNEDVDAEIGHHNLGILLAFPATQDYEPIPLTEEWLKRLGFEHLRKKDGTFGVYFNGKASVQLSNSGNVYTMRNKLIPYVHTFQNWYYYDQLTGEELNLSA